MRSYKPFPCCQPKDKGMPGNRLETLLSDLCWLLASISSGKRGIWGCFLGRTEMSPACFRTLCCMLDSERVLSLVFHLLLLLRLCVMTMLLVAPGLDSPLPLRDQLLLRLGNSIYWVCICPHMPPSIFPLPREGDRHVLLGRRGVRRESHSTLRSGA